MTKKAVVSQLRQHEKYERLIAATEDLQPLPTAVAHPCDETSLRGALEAAEAGMIVPILVGPKDKIRGLAEIARARHRGIEIVDVPHSQAAAEKAVELVRTGKAELLMKGSLHSDELLGEVTKRDTGLRTGRRISHVFVMDVPTIRETLFITDAAVNIAPDLDGEARHRPERDRPLRRAWVSARRRSRSCRRSRRSTRAFPRPSRRPRCARWPIAARSPAASSMARSPSTMPSVPRRRASRASSRRLRARRRFWSCPTSKPATCWRRT